MKNDKKLNICKLKRIIGNKINDILAVCGHNSKSNLKTSKEIIKSFLFFSFFSTDIDILLGIYGEIYNINNYKLRIFRIFRNIREF